jgi:outer membrane lipoprotein-sorting protein
MFNKRFTHVSSYLVLATAIALLIGSMVFTFASQAQAEGNGAAGTTAAVSSAFTYQGSLENGSGPVNDTCDMIFLLYDGGGIQIGYNLPKNNVAVSDGVFSVELDFGDAAFTGGERRLQIRVKCSGDSSYTSLSPDVTINAAPYALSLRPGALIEAAQSITTTLKVVNSNTSGTAWGIHGESQGTNYDSAGLFGYASAGSGNTKGVYGISDSPTGSGVFGFASASTGENIGVLGQTLSELGTGVHGVGKMNGVKGIANADNGVPYGVYGIASDNGSATSYGVYGESNSSVGTGVGGRAATNGVYGEATNSSGATWGVYGKSNSASGYGVYSNGNAHVEGDLTWKAVTSYVSVSASAFTPELYNDSGFVEHDNEGYYIKNESASSEWFVAPVQLPHGATVTDISVGWHDGSDNAGVMFLKRRTMITVTETADTMSSVASVGSVSTIRDGVWNNNTISFPDVDNANYTYYLELSLPAGTEDILMYGVVIEYTIGQPY